MNVLELKKSALISNSSAKLFNNINNPNGIFNDLLNKITSYVNNLVVLNRIANQTGSPADNRNKTLNKSLFKVVSYDKRWILNNPPKYVISKDYQGRQAYHLIYELDDYTKATNEKGLITNNKATNNSRCQGDSVQVKDKHLSGNYNISATNIGLNCCDQDTHTPIAPPKPPPKTPPSSTPSYVPKPTYQSLVYTLQNRNNESFPIDIKIKNIVMNKLSGDYRNDKSYRCNNGASYATYNANLFNSYQENKAAQLFPGKPASYYAAVQAQGNTYASTQCRASRDGKLPYDGDEKTYYLCQAFSSVWIMHRQ